MENALINIQEAVELYLEPVEDVRCGIGLYYQQARLNVDDFIKLLE